MGVLEPAIDKESFSLYMACMKFIEDYYNTDISGAV